MELYRVLLVDDEEDIREGISRKMKFLATANCQISPVKH